MTFRALPPEILAENLLKRGAIFAYPGDPNFAPTVNGVEDCMMDDHSINREMAISELRRLEDEAEAANMSFALETGLGHLLGLARHKVVTDPEWEPLHEYEHRRLLSSVFCGLGGAIIHMSDRIPIEQLQDGMLATATIINDLHTGQLDNDRTRDAVSRVRILIHRTRILKHEELIEERRLARERATVEKMRPAAKEGELFG